MVDLGLNSSFFITQLGDVHFSIHLSVGGFGFNPLIQGGTSLLFFNDYLVGCPGGSLPAEQAATQYHRLSEVGQLVLTG